MRQTGHWSGDAFLTRVAFDELIQSAIDRLDLDQTRQDVAPFVKDQQALAIWSREFFRDVASRIIVVEKQEA